MMIAFSASVLSQRSQPLATLTRSIAPPDSIAISESMCRQLHRSRLEGCICLAGFLAFARGTDQRLHAGQRRHDIGNTGCEDGLEQAAVHAKVAIQEAVAVIDSGQHETHDQRVS